MTTTKITSTETTWTIQEPGGVRTDLGPLRPEFGNGHQVVLLSDIPVFLDRELRQMAEDALIETRWVPDSAASGRWMCVVDFRSLAGDDEDIY